MNREFATSQELLFPVNWTPNPQELALLNEMSKDLSSIGYKYSIDNENKVILQGVPLDVLNGQELNSLQEVIEQYQEYEKIRHTDKRDNIAASFSCKAAIKTGQKLSDNEIKQLLEDLFKCEMPYSCPHGRPVIVEISLKELDKRFGRL